MTDQTPEFAHRLIRAFCASQRNRWAAENLRNARLNLNRAQGWLSATAGVDLDGRGIDADRDSDRATALAALLNDYLSWRLESVSPATATVDRRHLAAFYRWACADMGDGDPYIARNPMPRVPAPKLEEPAPERTRVVTQDDVDALLATCSRKGRARYAKLANERRDAAVIALLWATGMRRGELCGIAMGDVDWSSQMIHLRRTKGRTTTRSRDVYVDDVAMAFLDRYVHERGDHDGFLFESTRRDGPAIVATRAPLTSNGVGQMLERRARQASVVTGREVRTPAHGFRRGHAEEWLAAGGSQVALETNAGWQNDGRMVGRYTRRAATRLAADEARRVAEVRRGTRGHLRAV